MLGHIREITKIYDLLALCCSYIFKEYDKEPIEFSSLNYEDSKYNEVCDAIELYCEQCEEEGHVAAINELKRFIFDFLRSGINVEKCMAIVISIDELVEVKICGKIINGRKIVKYNTLNSQYTDQVKILPRFKDTFINRANKKLGNTTYPFLRATRENECSPIDNQVTNYMIWDAKHIEEYPVWIHHFDNTSLLEKHFDQRDKIVLGIVPFSNIDTKKLLNTKIENRTFYIENMNPDIEEKLKQKYIDICDKAEKEDIDFLVFPEMMMTQNILSGIVKKEKKSSPRIIVNGSIWKDKTNKSIVSDENGNEIFSYFKKNPYTFEKNGIIYREFLDKRKNKEYHILELEGFGRVGIGICKDLISEDVKLFHKYIGTNLLIVPAYTKSMDLESSAENLSKEYNCVVAVVNACSALQKEKNNTRIGFITLPAKMKSDRTGVTIRYFRDECSEECEKNCKVKKITIDFERKNTYGDRESFFVEEKKF